MKYTLKQLISVINTGKVKKEVEQIFKQNFINSLALQKYNNYSIINLTKQGNYKSYYVLAKEICETSYNKQSIGKFEDLNEMAELIYDDVFYNSYEIDGEGNINEISVYVDLDKS